MPNFTRPDARWNRVIGRMLDRGDVEGAMAMALKRADEWRRWRATQAYTVGMGVSSSTSSACRKACCPAFEATSSACPQARAQARVIRVTLR